MSEYFFTAWREVRLYLHRILAWLTCWKFHSPTIDVYVWTRKNSGNIPAMSWELFDTVILPDSFSRERLKATGAYNIVRGERRDIPLMISRGSTCSLHCLLYDEYATYKKSRLSREPQGECQITLSFLPGTVLAISRLFSNDLIYFSSSSGSNFGWRNLKGSLLSCVSARGYLQKQQGDS